MYTEDRVYRHKVEMIDGKKHYFISFVDVHGDKISQEVSFKVYEAFQDSQKIEARIGRSDRRHITRKELSDCEKGMKIPSSYETPEKIYIQDELIDVIATAIEALPPRQRKYLILSRIEGMTFREIGDCEGRPASVIHYSVKSAERKIKEIYKNFSSDFWTNWV